MSYVNPDFIAEVRRLCIEKGWREDPGRGSSSGPWFAAYCALATSEISEALDAYRDKVWSDTCPGEGLDGMPDHIPGCSGKPHDHPKPVGVGPELADAFIRLIDMADLWNVDIEHELHRVLEYGWTRPYKHGGRELLYGQDCPITSC